MRRDKKGKGEKDNSERWLLTYSDLMNLLLIFFIILFTFSQVNQTKFEQLASSLKLAMGSGSSSAQSYIPGNGSNDSILELPYDSSNSSEGTVDAASEASQMKDIMEKIQQLVANNNLGDNVHVSMQERGVIISITAQLLFKSGSAEIETEARSTVHEIGKILVTMTGKQIRIEGHTDSDPIRTSAYPSNWELSSARATNVVRWLVDQTGIDPASISACGYGEFRPKVPNDSEANKTLNRRVDIVILKSEYNKSEATSAASVN